jgi:hypothetical protein
MKRFRYLYILFVFLAACFEQRAVEQLKATVDRLCVYAPIERTIDRHLNTHAQGCVFVRLEETLAAGLDEVNLTPGVYSTSAANLGFQHYRDDVIVVRDEEIRKRLAFMTPQAYYEITKAADAIHEAQTKDEQLREGRGLTIYLEPRSFTPTKPTPLTPDQLRLVQKSL